MTNKKHFAQSAVFIASFTLVSKMLGFLREVLIASKYGSGMETDTYFAAMTATIVIMGALGTALNTTLIPIFSEVRAKKANKGQLKYLNNILNIIILITLVLSALAFTFSPTIMKIVAKGFEGEQLELAVRLNRIGIPIVVLLGITYVFSGFLQSNEIFGPHAIMGIPYNLVYLIYLMFFAKSKNIVGLMVVSVIAASTQAMIQVPAIRHRGYRHSFKINLKDPLLQKTIILVLPILLGSAVREINGVIDKTLASELVEGSISALTYAQKINDLVISVFVMAITTVVFPMLSQAFSDGDRGKIKDIFKDGVNLILLITVPATIGMIILSEPLVRIFFERNAFGSRATMMTSAALVFYSVGLVGASLRLLLNRVFYSFHDTKTPMINGSIAVVLNVVLNLLLIGPFGHAGLALATSAAAIFTTILLFIDLRKRMGPLGLKSILITFVKIFISAIFMGLVVYLVYYKAGGALNLGVYGDLAIFLLSIILGALVYFLACLLLKVKEVRVLVRLAGNLGKK